MALATLLANKAVERSLSHKLEDARDAVVNKLVEILTTYKSSMTAAGAGASAQVAICENLKMLPVLLLGLLKNVRDELNRCLLLLSSHPLGWNSSKCSDPSRSACLCAIPLNLDAFSTTGTLYLP